MAHIFKNATPNQNGIVVISHAEAGIASEHHRDIIDKIKNKGYFIGIHYGGFSHGATYPDFADFFMGKPSVTDIAQRYNNAFEIPVVSSNFTSTVFKKDPDAKKYWDIINISRSGNVKRLDVFFREVKKIYDSGKKYKILLVCAKRNEEKLYPEDHFLNIEDVYYDMFTDEERQLFTLMRLDESLEFKGLSKTQLSFFYQCSKVSTLFSMCEGSPGVIAESLLSEVPVVVNAGQMGSGRDLLNESNSVQWCVGDDNLAHSALIEAVENYDKFIFDMDAIHYNYREDRGLERLREYFTKLYENHEQEFDGSLINTDDLVSRLPSHYTNLPWLQSRLYNGHIRQREQFEKLYDEIINHTNSLELLEKEKYNYFVTKKGYGSDFERIKQIERIKNDLGDVSVGFKNILSELKEGGEFKVLDIGSGPGGVMSWLQKECGADVYGVDISEEFVKKSKEHFPSLENVFVANASDMNMFEDNSFNLVCHLDGMEHIPRVWEKSCLKEAIRVSKKYIFYEIACEDAYADGWSKEQGFTPAHINIKEPSEWIQFFKKHSEEFNYDIIFSHEGNKFGVNQSVILRKR
tara:strand:+ start:3690 stop:5420 length:1731 start_codon:yes stop_codon:yes gene_type:complete